MHKPARRLFPVPEPGRFRPNTARVCATGRRWAARRRPRGRFPPGCCSATGSSRGRKRAPRLRYNTPMPFGARSLWPDTGEYVDFGVFQVDGNLANRLHGVGVELRADAVGHLGHFHDGEQRSRFIVGPHHRNDGDVGRQQAPVFLRPWIFIAAETGRPHGFAPGVRRTWRRLESVARRRRARGAPAFSF